jgi:8-oxo-dGTP pyrophosphatase MutT (NUDIX family)
LIIFILKKIRVEKRMKHKLYRNNSFPSYPCYYNKQTNRIVDFPITKNCQCDNKKNNETYDSPPTDFDSKVPNANVTLPVTNLELKNRNDPPHYTRKQNNYKKSNYNEYNKPIGYYKKPNKKFNKYTTIFKKSAYSFPSKNEQQTNDLSSKKSGDLQSFQSPILSVSSKPFSTGSHFTNATPSVSGGASGSKCAASADVRKIDSGTSSGRTNFVSGTLFPCEDPRYDIFLSSSPTASLRADSASTLKPSAKAFVPESLLRQTADISIHEDFPHEVPTAGGCAHEVPTSRGCAHEVPTARGCAHEVPTAGGCAHEVPTTGGCAHEVRTTGGCAMKNVEISQNPKKGRSSPNSKPDQGTSISKTYSKYYDEIDDLDYHTNDYVNNYVYKNFDNFPNKKFNKTGIVCSNCRKKGHFQRQCKRPIRSYGIIALRSRNSEFEYLLIRRVHSIGFETFIRGRYNSPKELQALIDRMTSYEKTKVKTNTFDELWDDICVNKSTYFYKSGKKGAYDKFCKLDINTLFADISSPWLEPCWGFPKGRRQLHETEKECAIREFGEETDYRPNKYEIISRKPFIETYVGTNNIRYCHNYFIAFMDQTAPDAVINLKNTEQIAEVGDIRWLKFDDASNIMKPYDIEKKAVLKAVNQFVTSHYSPKGNNIIPINKNIF